VAPHLPQQAGHVARDHAHFGLWAELHELRHGILDDAGLQALQQVQQQVLRLRL
jgi:hypothetical protein